MLLEIVQSGPLLAGPRAILPKAEIHHLRPTLGLFIVNTFLVAGQVVDRAEAFLARAIGLVAFEQLTMSGLVFPKIRDECLIICGPSSPTGKRPGGFGVYTHLLSDGHLPTHVQAGCSHFTDSTGESTNSRANNGGLTKA